jgi:hypothetical protein
VRAYNARQRAEIRAEWERYHRDQAARHRATLEALIAHHTIQAEKLLKGEA